MRRRHAFAKVVAAGVVIGIVATGPEYWRTRQIREALYAALAPVHVSNCRLERFGDAHDGGYLMCGNLMTSAQAAYSYGIDGRDEWGCQVAARHSLPLHQYDCFNTNAPGCATAAAPRFHAECVGPEPGTVSDRPFDTLAGQIERNGDGGRRLLMKMDVEGSEWPSLLAAPDHVLSAIDQLVIEFHRVEDRAYLETAARLKQFFYVAHYHHNNFECRPGFEPFAGPVFELLLVSKRIAAVNPSVPAGGPSPLDAPNNPALADCQAPPGGSEARRLGRWLERKARGMAALLSRPFAG